MTKRMLIDASHAEETRVVVLDGNRLEDFDVETSTKRQLKGNIYLAKVVRVEPSLQAAFVEYGGNRHGFLAFSEIHPDYYQIPIADRQRLLDMEEEEARREEEEEEAAAAHHAARNAGPERREPAREPEPAPEPFALETTDESGAVIAIDPPGQPDHQQEANENAPAEPSPAAEPEPPVAETTDESGATIAIAAPEQTDHEAQPGENAPSDPPPAADPEPPAAETTDESGATLATEPPPTDEAPEETPAKPPRAQPMAIETERLSGPVEPAEPSSEFSPQPEAQSAPQTEEPPMAETGDESGATVELLSEARHEQPEPAEHPDEPDEDDEPFGYDEPMEESPPPETVGGEQDGDDRGERRMPSRFLRNYKIQEVIKRRQIMLVQVVKEERGTKGAALTSYISLAGRFSVLMPNSPRGGGISRKITSATDRRRLKEVISELDLPKGMGLIVRTAGANRPKPEIKRDCEYLLRLWDDIREHTLKSVAPALIYEEASLIKRAIRDVYSRDIDEIAVDGEEGWKQAHEFMRMLMPSHAKKVQLWRDGGQPLFARYQVEAQLDSMLLPTVQLRSGGYLVINQTEALVAIDVNSGRSTRERNVEETALRTNLEAADEAARQLRLRDLAGLIVIDFIDMESRKHNGMVEKRLKEALKNDRARIQVGHISHFGLLEMSRQRLRPSLAETSFIPCPHCGGTGHVRSTESAALHVLRGIEEEGSKRRAAEIVVHVATPIALYILNHKRDRLLEIEARYAMRVTLSGDDRQIEPQFRIDRLRPQSAPALPAAVTPETVQPALPPPLPEPLEEPEAPEAEEEAPEAEEAAESHEDDEEARAESGDTGEISAEEAERRRRRRRRRRRGRREDGPAPAHAEAETPAEPAVAPAAEAAPEPPEAEHIEGVPEHAEAAAGDDDRNRRRGRRGGRRRRREPGEAGETPPPPDAEQPDLPPVYTGPTPANPFGGHAFDIFDMLEQAEGYTPPPAPAAPPAEVTIIPGPPPETAVKDEPAEQLAILNTAAPEPAPEEPVAAEQAAAEAPATTEAPPAAAEMPPTEAVAAQPAEEPAAVETVELPAAERAAVETPAPPAAEPAPAEASESPASMAEAPPAPVAEEPPPEPAIKPILVGSPEEPPAEKKRGWWKR